MYLYSMFFNSVCRREKTLRGTYHTYVFKIFLFITAKEILSLSCPGKIVCGAVNHQRKFEVWIYTWTFIFLKFTLFISICIMLGWSIRQHYSRKSWEINSYNYKKKNINFVVHVTLYSPGTQRKIETLTIQFRLKSAKIELSLTKHYILGIT